MWDAWEKRFDKLKTDAVAIMGRYRTAAIAAVQAQPMAESEKGEAEKKYKLLEEKYNQVKDAAVATEVKRAALEVQVKQLCADLQATAAVLTTKFLLYKILSTFRISKKLDSLICTILILI